MDERLLVKCKNSIYANNIVNMLESNNIASRQHDELQDQCPGAYGAITGIAIYVYEKDYAKAKEIAAPIIKEMNEVKPFCPKCGSENATPINRKYGYGTITTVISILLMIIPGVYYAWTKGGEPNSPILNNIALAVAIVGVILAFAGMLYSTNYKCNDCGKKFTYR